MTEHTNLRHVRVIKAFWCVKYAMSSGKIEKRLLSAYLDTGRAYEKLRFGEIGYTIGKECFEDLEDAKAMVETMRKKRIASMKKGLAKMEAQVFVPVDITAEVLA